MKLKQQKELIRKAIASLRPFYEGFSDVEIAAEVLNEPEATITADAVHVYAQRSKVFSTNDVMSRFRVPKGNAAAAIAVLRAKRVLEPHGKTRDNASRWRYVG